jgi:RNA polymerase sigma factor (sigma-70 family)
MKPYFIFRLNSILSTKQVTTLSGIKTRQTLIEKIKISNDEQYWEKFCDAYKDYLFVIIRNMGLSYHDSEELLQEVLLKAWKSLPNFEYNPKKGKFRWWLITIVKNTVYNYLDKEKRRKQKLDSTAQLIADPEIDKLAKQEWEKFVVNKAWATIQSKFSGEVLEIFAELTNGKSVREIAEARQLPPNTIHVYKKRVQKKLYREIAKLDYELNC